jgi:hypothetical protein
MEIDSVSRVYKMGLDGLWREVYPVMADQPRAVEARWDARVHPDLEARGGEYRVQYHSGYSSRLVWGNMSTSCTAETDDDNAELVAHVERHLGYTGVTILRML